MRTIYIRHCPEDDSYSVVVKPHPGALGTNLKGAETKQVAQAHADKLAALFDWPVVDQA